MGSGGLGSVGSMVGLDDLKGLFQIKQFCDSMAETALVLDHVPVLCRMKVVSLTVKESFSECKNQFLKYPAVAVVWGYQT